jgi:hypothetical protein
MLQSLYSPSCSLSPGTILLPRSGVAALLCFSGAHAAERRETGRECNLAKEFCCGPCPDSLGPDAAISMLPPTAELLQQSLFV